MQFDFRRFSKIAAGVYNQRNPYTLEECLEVFRLYFETYEEYTGRAHPPIRTSQIASIIQDMPYLKRPCQEFIEYLKTVPNFRHLVDITPDTYPILIQLHFKTKYRHCDYNINHFFSGKIRYLRRCEADAGYV